MVWLFRKDLEEDKWPSSIASLSLITNLDFFRTNYGFIIVDLRIQKLKTLKFNEYVGTCYIGDLAL